MEPFAKRQRLYAPVERATPVTGINRHAYYDDEGDELGDDFLADEEEFGEEEPELGSDPEADLQQKRAQLDYKLKSTFESIFDKYERDFDGVGDEIDLETGEIVVNNGHILDMAHERDAGDISRARQLGEYTEEPSDIPTSSLDETEMLDMDMDIEEEDDEEDEEEDDEEDVVSDEEMVEDDLILRGFAKANRFPQGALNRRLIEQPVPLKERRRETIPPDTNILPSRATILAQFGPQLGPEIVKYVSKQNVRDDSHMETSRRVHQHSRNTPAAKVIESAWRVPALPSVRPPRQVEAVWQIPELPSARPAKQVATKQRFVSCEEIRSSSPEASASIWAPTRPRGRRRLDGADSNALYRGESTIPAQYYRPPTVKKRPEHVLPPRQAMGFADYTPQAESSARLPPTRPANHSSQSSSPRTYRIEFTAEEDKILMARITDLRRQRIVLDKIQWKALEAEYPQHTWSSWKQRYIRKFTYLTTDQVIDSDPTSSDVDHENLAQPLPQSSHVSRQMTEAGPLRASGRPGRIRKPAQTNTNIISWTQAVDAIESLDPELHAGLMEDVNNAESSQVHSSLPYQNLRLLQKSTEHDILRQRREPMSMLDEGQSPDLFPVQSSLAIEPTPEQEDALVPGAPCPHADCRLHPTILYKLQRQEHEDVSEMCLHLFRIHHTTPFPCGEVGCTKKGEDGYFMQVDLVKHVRIVHKGPAALHRLRGRVDPALLDVERLATQPRQPSSSSHQTARQPRDSDFMASQKPQLARNPSSSQPSPDFDPDRTATPRGYIGVATFTPNTSVSSMKAHHASVTSMPKQYASNARDRTVSDPQASSSSGTGESAQQNLESQPLPRHSKSEPHDMAQKPMITQERLTKAASSSLAAAQLFAPVSQASIGGYEGFWKKVAELPSVASRRASLDRRARQGQHFTPPLTEGAIPSEDAQQFLSPTPETCDIAFAQLGDKHSDSRDIHPMEPTGNPSQVRSSSSSASSIPAEGCRISDPAINMSPDRAPSDAEEVLLGVPPISIRQEVSKVGRSKLLTRQTIAPSYDFSDEETGAMTQSAAPVSTSVPKKLSKQRAKAPLVTPSVKRPVFAKVFDAVATNSSPMQGSFVVAKAVEVAPTKSSPIAKRKTPRHRSEGVDELSLGTAEFVMLSSRRVANTLPAPQLGIKQEDSTLTPNLRSVPAVRKRKLGTLHDDDYDELGVLGTAVVHRLLGGSNPEVKSETDDTMDVQRQIMPMPKRKRKTRTLAETENDTTNLSHSASRVLPVYRTVRTCTPLLDLTPVRNVRSNADRMKEIGDSEAETSELESPVERTKRAQTVRSSQDVRPSSPTGDLSPISKSRWTRDSLKAEQVAIVVKTPGGTIRRCGVDGFSCRKSFCFRCGKDERTAV